MKPLIFFFASLLLPAATIDDLQRSFQRPPDDARIMMRWWWFGSLDATAHLKPGSNRLRIVVANTAINYMAGHPLPDHRLLNLRYGVRFEPQDMDKVQPVPSGLLGPVRLITGN